MRKLKYMTTSYCQPCKLYGPVLKRLAADYSDVLEIEKIDIEEHPEVGQKYGVTNVPTVIEVDSNDQEIHRVVGALPYDQAVEQLV